jgi:hypothetical protein
LNAYRSTGGFLSVWIDLDDCLANPANHVAGDCVTGALVLTERDGVYRDLWEGRWELEGLTAVYTGCRTRPAPLPAAPEPAGLALF